MIKYIKVFVINRYVNLICSDKICYKQNQLVH